MKSFHFNTPKEIYFGRNSFENLKKGLLIVSPSVWKNHFEKLKKIDLKPIIFKRQTPTSEPGESDIVFLSKEIKKHIKTKKPERIVAVGGGSVIDAVKIALQFVWQKNLTFEDIYAHRKFVKNKIPLVGVETTCGTGTGVTAVGVVLGRDNIKRGILNVCLLCDVAIYDPVFLYKLPEEVVINSGMDALTHAVESFSSKKENIPADTLSLKAIELIVKNIKKASQRNKKALENLHCGNMLGGLAFTNARLGICHALAHLIGGRFAIPHGRINAILLPYVVEFNFPYTQKYREIERILKIKNFVRFLRRLNEELRIESSLKFLGEKFKNQISQIARECERAKLVEVNPWKPKAQQIKKLLENTIK